MAHLAPAPIPDLGLSSPTRRPFRGSCHCGHIQYIAYLTLPTNSIRPTQAPPSTSKILKCNCSTCRKMGFFHVRTINPPLDFQLLSPLKPSDELVDYQCFAKHCHWYFCGTCGVRCFALAGEGEIRIEEVDGEKREIWGFKAKEWEEDGSGYLSVNAVTLEPQDGLDLREWVEKGWIAYFDDSKEDGDQKMGIPHPRDMF